MLSGTVRIENISDRRHRAVIHCLSASISIETILWSKSTYLEDEVP